MVKNYFLLGLTLGFLFIELSALLDKDIDISLKLLITGLIIVMYFFVLSMIKE